MPKDYVPVLPNPLKPPIPDLTTLSDWKKATDAGTFSFRNNDHTVAIDAAITRYHATNRLWHKYIELDKITDAAAKWIKEKEAKTESSRRASYNAVVKHVLALRRYPSLEPIDKIVFRGDKRNPAELFQSGFTSQKLSPPVSIGTDGHTWQDGGQSGSQVVSTSLCIHNLIGHYAAGGYLYAVKADQGIDLKENGDHEIALLGIPGTDIICAIGKLLTNRAISDGALISQLNFEGTATYIENPACTVPLNESRITRAWFKKLAGEPLNQQDLSDLINMLQAM